MERLAKIGLALAAVEISRWAFTRKERNAIVERDGERCNFPSEHDCNGEDKLQVHHILPQRFLEKLGVEPDFPENGLTVCENAHLNLIHEDIGRAKREYSQNQNVYNEVFIERDKKLKNREIYWNDDWDRKLMVTALRNTQRAEKKGWKFPGRRGKV